MRQIEFKVHSRGGLITNLKFDYLNISKTLILETRYIESLKGLTVLLMSILSQVN